MYYKKCIIFSVIIGGGISFLIYKKLLNFNFNSDPEAIMTSESNPDIDPESEPEYPGTDLDVHMTSESEPEIEINNVEIKLDDMNPIIIMSKNIS